MLKAAVSVLIPTYNGSAHLAQCIESVLSQTLRDIEVLVVDDSSSDKTLDIARTYAAQDARVRVVVNEHNLGLVGNWNRCAHLARGEWVKFVFQDDFLAPTCLESMLAVAKPEVPIVACRRDFWFDEHTDEETRQYYLSHLGPDTVFKGKRFVPAEEICEAVIDHVGVNIFGEPSAVLLHRDVFTQFGFFNPELIMICDTEYWTRVATHTGLTYVPETLATFRVHASSTSAHNFSKRQYRMELDGVILLHEYAFGNAYASLRQVAARRTDFPGFAARLEEAAAGTRWLARDANYRKERPDATLLDEWNRFIARYPRVDALLAGDVRRTSLLSRAYKRLFG